MTINNSSISNNIGGVQNYGILTINNSSINNNTNNGILSDYGSTLNLNNSTVSNNYGTGVSNTNATTFINNTTIAHNYPSGIRMYGGNFTIKNTILAGNTLNDCVTDYGTITSQGYNIISNTNNCSIISSTGDQFDVNPQIGPFIAQTGTHPLASTSPAIDAGNNATCYGTTDQRGQTRVDGPDIDSVITCDIGAYEYSTPDGSSSIHAINEGNHHTPPHTTFSQPFKVSVLDSYNTPVGPGIEVIFTAPANGASGYFEGGYTSISVLTDEFGVAATPLFTANNEFGDYTVIASTSGVISTAEFALGNYGLYVSTDGSDSNNCNHPSVPCLTINGALAKSMSEDTISVATGTYTGNNEQVVLIDKSITLSGGWDETFTTQSGFSIIDGQNTRKGIKVISYITPNTTAIDHFAIQNGNDSGIEASNSLTINNSTINNNTSGIISYGQLKINNSTVSNNKGTGIYSAYGTVFINNATIAQNQGYGISTLYANASLQNTILTGNSSSDCIGTITSQGYNIISNTNNCSIISTTGDQFNVDPQIGPFIAQTGTHPLAPTSPAIDAGNNATCYGTTDQRRQTRVDGPDIDSVITCDIGAYEFSLSGEPAGIHIVSGGGQHTNPNTAFPQLLKTGVLDSIGTPVEGIEVLFTAPNDGPSGNFEGNSHFISVLTDEFGIATTPIFTANGEYGGFVVNTSISGVADVAEFEMENSGWLVSPGGSNTNNCRFPSSPCLTINAAINKALPGETIRIATGTYTSTGAQVVNINKGIILSGGWNETFTIQSGKSTIDGQNKRRGIFVYSPTIVVVDHFIIQNGYDDGEAGGVYNRFGDLTINNSVVKNNRGDWYGGGITNEDNLTLNYTAVSGNTTGKGGGGGGGYGGAGIRNEDGIVTLNNSTVSNNKIIGGYSGSGIFSQGTLILNNSTVSGNTGSTAEGILTSGTAIFRNSTITNNEFFGINIRGRVTLQNTIIAGNKVDCYTYPGLGRAISKGYNLIGNVTGCSFEATIGDQVGTTAQPINPQLAPLRNNGGPTFTHALYETSPALNAGNPVLPGSNTFACTIIDQRGVTRPEGSACDIGAFEGFVLYPNTLLPTGAIIDTTPKYEWSKTSNATKYQYELWKGATLIYTKTMPASRCGGSSCFSTPSNVLNLGTYKWRVRAMIGGVWKNYSPYKPFVVSPAKPGFWSGQGVDFFVNNTAAKVGNFSISIYVNGCGGYYRRVTHEPLVSISSANKQFGFTGSFYANGVFITPTYAQGTLGLSSFYIPGCGYLTGGPFSWTATWIDGSQPGLDLNEGDAFELIASPEFSTPFEIFTIDPEK